MTTLSTLPVYAAPNIDAQLIFTLTETGSNFCRVWVTAAPPDSALRKELDKSTQNRFPIYEGDGGPNHSARRRFDLGGKYTLVAQEYVRGATAYGGGYQNSPDGAPGETKVGAEVTLSLHIGQRLTSQLAVGADILTIALWVWNDTIRQTTVGVQGEDSPSVQATSATPRAIAAIESAAVAAALAALRDQAVNAAIGVASTVFTDLLAKWNAHLAEPSIHSSNDPDNVMVSGLAGDVSVSGLATVITEVLPLIRQHYTNDASKTGIVFGRNSAAYHEIAGALVVNDNANLPLIAGASQSSDTYWATAELCRSYEAHRPSTNYHLLPDSINVLADRPLLMRLGEAILEVLASVNPATPTTQSTGAMYLIAQAGFAETPL